MNYITPEMMNMLFAVVILPLLGAVSAYAIKLLKKKTLEIEVKLQNDQLSKYIDIAENAIETAVIATQQIFVDSAKKDIYFNKVARQEAFDMAKQKALSIMGSTIQAALDQSEIDLDAWMDAKIESYVKKHK